MTLAPGSRLGPYEITASLGAGGMGEVWRATDSHLGREVALKLLPEGFAADPERLARFEREARMLASLNHPHIAQIYGVEASGERRALVMELVEGETLEERLAQGAVPLDDAIAIARQIAEALEEAHEKGLVHRDLKPANVKVTADGRVKVLDFGLAKAMEIAPASGRPLASPALMNSPTLASVRGTELGVILGTAAYMAPEQAKGHPVDKRADIWAFGVVLLEMLSGRRVFAGETVSETLAAVLRDEVDLTGIPQHAPSELGLLLRRCLERDVRRRLRDMGEARIALERIAAGGTVAIAAPATTAAPSRSGNVAAGRALGLFALIAVAAGAGWLAARRPAPESTATAVLRPTFRQLTKTPGGEGSPSLSPDGESFVFVKRDGEDLDLFVQRIDGTKAIALTADCEQDDFDPAFSPDGRSIAFHSECDGVGVFVMGATGESRRRVADLGFAPAWSPDGSELAVTTERLNAPTSRNSSSELWAVRIDSGERRMVTEHDAMAPTWSPDGRRIAFWGLRGDSFQRDLWSVAADGSERATEAARTIFDDPPLDWAPVYSHDGRWLYFGSTRGGTFNLWRVPIDATSGERRGEPEPVTAPSSWAGPYSLSADGSRLVFVDRNNETAIMRAPFDPERGGLTGAPAEAFSGSFELREQEISPAGDWILFSNEDLPQQLHLVRPDGSGYRQLTEGAERNRQGDWSPGGDWIVFQTTRGDSALAAIRADGGGWQSLPVGLGLSTPRWAPDGSTISAFNTDEGGVLFDVRGGIGAPVRHPLPPVADGILFWPAAWSSDSALLAGRGTVEGVNRNVVVRSLTDGAYRTVASMRGGSNFAVTFVGPRQLVYSEGREIWIVDAVGESEPRNIYSAPAGRRIDNLSSTLDGRWLTWIERTDESDIWLMTLDQPAAANPAGVEARP